MGSLQSNNIVRQQLAEMGDDGATVRHVIHYAFPLGAGGPDDRMKVESYLAGLGFKVKDAGSDRGIVMEIDQAVAGTRFDELTDQLVSFLDRQDWSYDGWECAVVPSSVPSPEPVN